MRLEMIKNISKEITQKPKQDIWSINREARIEGMGQQRPSTVYGGHWWNQIRDGLQSSICKNFSD